MELVFGDNDSILFQQNVRIFNQRQTVEELI